MPSYKIEIIRLVILRDLFGFIGWLFILKKHGVCKIENCICWSKKGLYQRGIQNDNLGEEIPGGLPRGNFKLK